MPDVETVILRFRDLGSTKAGGTIKDHVAIINSHKFVWWGWWSKPNETIPDSVFRALKKKAKAAAGLDLYLFHSGDEEFFHALCMDIDWKNTHAAFSPAEADQIPKYYRKGQFGLWFKLTKIEKVPFSPSLSYVEIPAFFKNPVPVFAKFDGKTVDSPDELAHQQRTIWFVRAAKPEDPSHKILLSDPFSFAPAHFPKDFLSSTSRNLLWVSDLHFGKHSFPTTGTLTEQTLPTRIKECLDTHDIGDIGGIIASGDFTWTASPKEYEQADEFLKWLESDKDLRPYQSVICPGNHDISWVEDAAAPDLAKPLTVVQDASADCRKGFEAFYRERFKLAPNKFISSGRRLLLGGAVPVEIVSLNSSLAQQHKDWFQGHGFVGEDQLKDAAQQMGWSTDAFAPRAIRIVVVHHHLVPITYRDKGLVGGRYSVLLDAEAMSRWIVEHGVDLVLHGHMHEPFVERITRPVNAGQTVEDWRQFYIAGMGSTGVGAEHVGSEVAGNVMGVLSFEQSRIKLSVYTLHATNPSVLKWSVDLRL